MKCQMLARFACRPASQGQSRISADDPRLFSWTGPCDNATTCANSATGGAFSPLFQIRPERASEQGEARSQHCRECSVKLSSHTSMVACLIYVAASIQRSSSQPAHAAMRSPAAPAWGEEPLKIFKAGG